MDKEFDEAFQKEQNPKKDDADGKGSKGKGSWSKKGSKGKGKKGDSEGNGHSGYKRGWNGDSKGDWNTNKWARVCISSCASFLSSFCARRPKRVRDSRKLGMLRLSVP